MIIYFLFIAAASLAIVLTVLGKIITDQLKQKTAAEISELFFHEILINEIYETLYWGAQLAFVHKYIVTAFEMP